MKSETLADAFQLYFDFSGYSDMAIGLSLFFHVRLPDNFNAPYRATHIVDFWRRWHITLSRFLRDYVYIPLGRGWLGDDLLRTRRTDVVFGRPARGPLPTTPHLPSTSLGGRRMSTRSFETHKGAPPDLVD